MGSDFNWKLMIAGTVGGACALISSILVFVILACRHNRKLKRRAAERLNRQRLSAQWSSSPAEPTPDLVRGLWGPEGAIASADLPLPNPSDGNYIRPPWAVGQFFTGQNSLNHDSGCADLESNRTDSVLFMQRSFSPLPGSINHAGLRALPADIFPAMSRLEGDSACGAWSHSFDLSSPTKPYLNINLNNDVGCHAGNPSRPCPMQPAALSGEEAWKARISCRAGKNVRTYNELDRSNCGLQLVEIAQSNNHLRSQYTGCHASMPSSSDNDENELVWVRRTSINPDGNLTHSAVGCSQSDALSSWRQAHGNQSIPNNRLAWDLSSPQQPAAFSYGRAIPDKVVHHKVSAGNRYKYASSKNPMTDNSWQMNGNIENVTHGNKLNTNRLSSR